MELLFDQVGVKISCLKILDITTNVTGDKYKISRLKINFGHNAHAPTTTMHVPPHSCTPNTHVPPHHHHHMHACVVCVCVCGMCGLCAKWAMKQWFSQTRMKIWFRKKKLDQMLNLVKGYGILHFAGIWTHFRYVKKWSNSIRSHMIEKYHQNYVPEVLE